MKGFKSFADTTVLEFEPGVTAVVGPNGSGKSNVVDAVTWVLGAQSTRALRSARMDDVIFMGTASRAALGRAEVSLTIDNSSGRLAIDGAEVTISRTLFRSGDSEYAINGTTCRLLDVQELLGDSGVGRQQHMIIGQGQLDSILSSNPENRRAVIEEAAGVLKHRRRKERSERRLAATQENLERLGDLVREVRRQMRPLERQAASARSYADVEAELRDARVAWFGQRLRNFERRQSELAATRADASRREEELRNELLTLDQRASTAAADMASRREEVLASTLGTLQALAERARGTSSVIQERERSLRQALIAAADENVIATLEADAARLASDLEELSIDERSLGQWRDKVDELRERFVIGEREFEDHFGSSSQGDEAAFANALEHLALLERSLASLRESARRATERYRDAEGQRELLSNERAETSSAHDRATTNLGECELAVARAQGEHERAQRERRSADDALRRGTDAAARAHARADTLSRALDELSGAGGRAIIGQLDGVLGSFLELIEVEAGSERAVESAAGASIGAMVVDGGGSARAAMAALRREGGAGLILTIGDGQVVTPSAPEGCVALRTLVRARDDAPRHVTRVLDALFSRAFVVGDWESGIDLALANPDLIIVTAEGDRFASSGWRVASGRALVTRHTLDEALVAAEAAANDVHALQRGLDDAETSVANTLEQLNLATLAHERARRNLEQLDLDAQRQAHSALRLDEVLATLSSESTELAAQISEVESEISSQRADLSRLERAAHEASERERQRLEAKANLETLRGAFDDEATQYSRHEAQFAERRRLIEQRSREIEQRLEGRSGERQEAAARRESLEFDAHVLGRLGAIVQRAANDIRVAQEALDSTYREQLVATRASAELLQDVRRDRRSAEVRLHEVVEVLRSVDIEQAELAVKVANVHESVRRDLGVEPSDLDGAHPGEDAVCDDDELEQRVVGLEARMTSLGPINPLALEELAALEERYKDLDAQVSDVRHARRELQEVMRALDEEIMATFSAAFVDVNEHFSALISMLFPGGQGRLHMSEPEDPLNTGVEIEVRPMGRNVRRISLLSGGERSMAALAFLFAVFRSRPSPFYLMDEVEAALDDVNLQRFLTLVDEFRDDAQLLIVTHQKRTMEAADVLYGVTMVPGASSKVVSQRVSRSAATL